MNELDGRFEGEVLKYDATRSFGFIKIKDKFIKGDAFIYYKDIEPEKDGFKKLQQGQVVEFDLIRNEKGLVAKNLKIVSGGNYDEFGYINGNK